MKKFATILMALVFVSMMSFSASAQSKMGIGIKAGLNMASVGGDGTDNYKSRMGLYAGALFEVQFSDMFAGQIEAAYSMEGAKEEGTMMGVAYTATVKLDYLEIPILLKVILPVPAVNPYIIVGPALGINLGATVTAEAGGQTHDTDIKDAISGTDFGLAFGAGVAIPMGLIVELRYTLGLSNINKDNDTVKNHNNVFAILAGWEFKI
jgi:hypothetical protein